MTTASIILSCSSAAIGVPIDDEPLSSTEDLLVPYKQEIGLFQDTLKNEVFCKLSTSLINKKIGLGPNCIGISPKVISYLKLYDYESGYFWHKSFTYREGLIKVRDTSTEDAKKLTLFLFVKLFMISTFSHYHPNAN